MLNQSLSNQNANTIPFDLLEDLILPEPPKTEGEDGDGERYIMHSRQIDTYTIKRSRVLLTPGVCDKCGLDLVKLAYDQNKLQTTNYYELQLEVQTIMQQLVQKHKAHVHTSADDLIVTSKPRKWLSGR